jgi:hypothetical protein
VYGVVSQGNDDLGHSNNPAVDNGNGNGNGWSNSDLILLEHADLVRHSSLVADPQVTGRAATTVGVVEDEIGSRDPIAKVRINPSGITSLTCKNKRVDCLA